MIMQRYTMPVICAALSSSSLFGYHCSFSDDHEFEKPNDARALNLMNACTVAVQEEFRDVVFAYGVSDEYRSLISFPFVSL
ncbi:hypothetical protein SASPL_135300 [Salvia splendens]|uniref:tRNAHis guanylyltransferase catalytic domain-containing protein n=1 Tax=Salvia splendens TaxID=180675 RepID=A0A8X8WZV2_SALSN|nr:hypothetical protein SASPL_135300 [Salvia splendens]